MATAETSEPTSNPDKGPNQCAPMDEELSTLTSNFKGQCRISSDDRKFVKTVKLHPENLDIVFNFKLTENYPDSPPVIVIRSESLSEDEVFDLHTFMTQSAESMSPISMETLVNDAIGWLEEGGISLKGSRNSKKTKKDTAVDGENKTKKTKKSKKKPTDKEDKKKKPPMRTAMDVVERIQWDQELPQDQFVVGYLDRMLGLLEKYFTAFSWEDIASVDYTVLAIPKHRIQYFKYKGEIVWDKRCRLDNVFGSTGSGKTIRDVIAKIDGRREGNDDGQEAANAEQGEEHADSDYYDGDDFTDSDSDDDINVVIGNEGGGAYGGYSDDGGDEDGENANADNNGDVDKYWRDKLRPNYFIALRITDEEMRQSVQEIQDHIASNDGRLKECSIPRGALHITLCTVGLETPDQVQNAIQCLQEAREELVSIVPKTKKLKFKGVDNFFNRVVYGKVVDCPSEFFEFVEHLKLCLNEKGVSIRDYHEFVPHMTLMKISRPFGKATGKKYVPPWLYSCFGDKELGSQSVDNIHLCQMGDSRQDDGFYLTAASLEI